MKQIFFIALFGMMGLIPFHSSAQVSVNVNIGSQPAWGPVGYDHVDYYYLPDIESYYYVPKRQFVYLSNNNWVFSASLPSRYRHYDLYNGYKVVINSRTPYHYHRHHKVKYAKYKHRKSQRVIRYHNDHRYNAGKVKYKNSGNKHYRAYNGHGNGKGNGNGKGKGGHKGNGHGRH